MPLGTKKRKRYQRPPPPPDPPESLVKLIQSDPKVLAYFSSLQANLEADVSVWKDRANRLKQQIQKIQQQPAVTNETKETTNGRKGQPPSEQQQGEPIDDAMLELELESDDEDERDFHEHDVQDSHHRREVSSYLKQAYLALEYLGVGLVTVTVVDETTDDIMAVSAENEPSSVDTCNQQDKTETLNQKNESIKRVVITPCSKEQVASDLLQSIRQLTRLSQQSLPDYYPPFTDTLLPACYEESVLDTQQQNPLVLAQQLVVRSLLILDTYCGSELTDEEWSRYFDIDVDDNLDETVVENMRVGLRGRKDMVVQLMQTLHGEFVQGHACHDRTARLENTALHYEKIESDSLVERTSEHCDTAAVYKFGSKSQTYLSLLLERVWHGSLLVAFYLSKNDYQKAVELICGYVVSTAPALAVESYPKLPPVLSLVVLEGMLRYDELTMRCESMSSGNSTPESWLFRYLQRSCGESNGQLDNDLLHFWSSLSVCIHATASIWNDRCKSDDDRIRDIAQVEMACYERLLRQENSWLRPSSEYECCTVSDRPDFSSSMKINEISSWLERGRVVAQLCMRSANLPVDGELSWLRAFSLQLALVLTCVLSEPNALAISSVEHDAYGMFCRAVEASDCNFAVGIALAIRQLALRQLVALGGNSGKKEQMSSLPAVIPEVTYGKILDTHSMNETEFLRRVSICFNCSAVLGDGQAAIDIIKSVLWQKRFEWSKLLARECASDCFSASRFFTSLSDRVKKPTVRVINLRCRNDRMNFMHYQALRESLVVVLGVAELNDESSSKQYFGYHAIDGRGRMAEAMKKLTEFVGGATNLNTLVNVYWRPNDLRPFDKDAPRNEDIVRMTASEVACAISHIACWKGVLRSLQVSELKTASDEVSGLFRHPLSVQRSLLIGGFAKGPALDPANSSMPPAAVCIVLEDDAILVDRFQERLSELLFELPRDFHFCSLGYGRPKTAPIGRYANHCGIPSHVFYLTGYILSATGAEYLLSSLPVVGPVDSWIGLKMTNNWDNVFGAKLGVGVQSRPFAELPSRKDLCLFLKFRAFCALHPLCSQRIGTTEGVVAANRSWRQRDTDIQYSGDQVYLRK